MTDAVLIRLGARIRQARKELGMTQAELASDACTKSFISQIEQGRVWPSLPLMIHIALRLERPIDWFLADDPVVPLSPIEQLAEELGVDPGRLRAALERVLFGDGSFTGVVHQTTSSRKCRKPAP